MKCRCLLPFLALPVFGVSAYAWLVGPRSDAEIMDNAQLVVVAHIQTNSLRSIPHGSSYETQATLVVDHAIKGKKNNGEIPIMIHYGVVPIPQSCAEKIGTDFDRDLPFSYDYSKPILLFEDNPSEGFALVCSDIRKDQIWFLRRYTRSTYDDTVMTNDGALGVLDFRDVQPMTKEKLFRKIVN
jgi:hypothetical protein